MNPLNDHPAARRALYQVQFVVAGVLLLLGVGYGAAGNELPQWYAITSTVTAALWSYLGITAASNLGILPTHHRRSIDDIYGAFKKPRRKSPAHHLEDLP